MTTDEHRDGPDGLQRLHAMLAAAFGVEIPSGDYHASIVLLDELGVSLRGIVELMSRFTRFPRGQLINDVNGVVAGEIAVDDAHVSQLKQLLVPHGYDALLAEASPKWVSGRTGIDPLDPSIPPAAASHWEALLRVFPNGLQTPKEYVTVLAVLQDQGLQKADIEAVTAPLIVRPRALIARDIDRLGTILIVAEADKAELKRQLGLQ